MSLVHKTLSASAAVTVLGCLIFLQAPALAQTATTAAVTIDNFSFNPAVLEIPRGTTVTWTNRDDIPHTVVEKSIAFRSKAIDTDEQFSHTFDTPGEIDYFCSLHPHMTGKIRVKP